MQVVQVINVQNVCQISCSPLSLVGVWTSNNCLLMSSGSNMVPSGSGKNGGWIVLILSELGVNRHTRLLWFSDTVNRNDQGGHPWWKKTRSGVSHNALQQPHSFREKFFWRDEAKLELWYNQVSFDLAEDYQRGKLQLEGNTRHYGAKGSSAAEVGLFLFLPHSCLDSSCPTVINAGADRNADILSSVREVCEGCSDFSALEQKSLLLQSSSCLFVSELPSPREQLGCSHSGALTGEQQEGGALATWLVWAGLPLLTRVHRPAGIVALLSWQPAVMFPHNTGSFYSRV